MKILLNKEHLDLMSLGNVTNRSDGFKEFTFPFKIVKPEDSNICELHHIDMENTLNEAVDLISYFIKRVEDGSIRSKTTYDKYKAFLGSIKAGRLYGPDHPIQ